ncbi:MAG: hypothetical protein Q8R00_01060 [Candidatus Nanoarchaeia archaeon]|nr:hypothetical protein [Candidatus Nanoarchaeia archaeon]
MKCAVCGEKIEEIFLNKILGTYVKKKAVCINCQKTYSMKEIKEKLK